MVAGLDTRFVSLATLCTMVMVSFPQAAGAASLQRCNTGHPLPAGSHAFFAKHRSGGQGGTHHKERQVSDAKQRSRRAALDEWTSDNALLDMHHHQSGDTRQNHDHDHDHKSRSSDNHPFQRRSFTIHGESGDDYLVSTYHSSSGTERTNQHKRAIQGVEGSVAIVDGTRGERLASLTVSKSPANSTNNATFVVGASNTNEAQFFIMPVRNSHASSSGLASDHDIAVLLQTAVFKPEQAEEVAYCATYDPNPPKPQALEMQPCDNDTTPGRHRSQLFSFNTYTSAISPVWPTNGTNGTHANGAGSNSSTAGNSSIPSSSSAHVGTRSTNVTAGGTAPRQNSTLASGQARNVTLVFVVAALEVQPMSSNSTNNSATTATLTTTTVASMTSASAKPVYSFTNATTKSSSSSSTAIAQGSLDVEWIPASMNTSSTSTSSSVVTSTISSIQSSTSSTGAASINAEAVASSIAWSARAAPAATTASAATGAVSSSTMTGPSRSPSPSAAATPMIPAALASKLRIEQTWHR